MRVHPRLVDAAVSVTYLVLLLPGLAHTLLAELIDPALGYTAIGATLAIAAALMFRRTHPLLVLAVVFLLAMTKTLGCGLLDAGSVPVALYAATAYLLPRPAWVAFAGTLFATAALIGIVDGADSPSLIVTLSLSAAAGILGHFVGLLRRYRLSERLRAEQAEHEREQEAELSVAHERAAFSRDVHDVIGHTLTAVVNLSDGALRTFESDPELAREGLRRINDIARGGLIETRSVLDAAAPAPHSPSVPMPTRPATHPHGIPALLDVAREAGLLTSFTATGESPEHADGTTLTNAFRIVQESVTNAVRHAKDASSLEVDIACDPEAVSLRVHNDGSAQSDHVPPPGRGLTGIAQRAALTGGTAEAGPAPEGGWIVAARLPWAAVHRGVRS